MVNVSASIPAVKRKRGRPRKDGNLSTLNRSPEYPYPVKRQQTDKKNPKDAGLVDSMVGRMIYGVIEGSFDAGFLVSIRIGSNATPYRGVVFEPEKFVPITAANNVAAKMYKRRELPIPVYDHYQTHQGNGISTPPQPHAVFRPVLPSIPLSPTTYVYNHPGTKGSHNNMVNLIGEGNNDILKGSNIELHLNFMGEILQNDMICSEMEQRNTIKQTGVYYHDEQNASNFHFHQDLFTDQCHPVDRISNSPNQQLDLNELKSTNFGLHQPLASGNNSLLLSPGLTGQHLEFMLEKQKSPLNKGTSKESNLELESRYIGSGERFSDAAGVGKPINYDESAPYELQLCTTQSALRTRHGNNLTASSSTTGCICDFDFVLSNVRGAQGHGSYFSESKHR